MPVGKAAGWIVRGVAEIVAKAGFPAVALTTVEMEAGENAIRFLLS